MDPIIVHKGDDRPALIFRLLDIEANEWLDLSDGTTIITAKFRDKGGDTVLDTVVCSKLYGGSTGYCSMPWPATALDDGTGAYEIEISVSFDGEIQTANKYYLEGSPLEHSSLLPIWARDEF